jgi:hypothetical protein
VLPTTLSTASALYNGWNIRDHWLADNFDGRVQIRADINSRISNDVFDFKGIWSRLEGR